MTPCPGRPGSLLGSRSRASPPGSPALAETRHAAFWSGRFDLGNLTQAVWSTAHGHFLEMTDLQGRQISRLGAHFDPIVAVLAPLWRIWPSPRCSWSSRRSLSPSVRMPVFLLARKHLGSEWAGLGFALAYLLYPADPWLVVDDFHPVALATPLLLAGLLAPRRRPAAGVRGRRRARLPDEGAHRLRGRGDGALVRRSRGAGPSGSSIAVAGAAVSLVAIAVIVPHFAPGGGSPFQCRYAAVGRLALGDRQDGAHRSRDDPRRR